MLPAACKVNFPCPNHNLSLGWRVSMEDSHIANLKIGKGIYLFGVFDGHGGIFYWGLC